MNEEKKIIQLDTAGTEDRLKEALPVLSAPESLSAENVARALSGAKKARRIPLGKYVSAAVAAVLVLVIGIGAVSGGLLNRKKETAPDMVMPGDPAKDPSGGYELNEDPAPAGTPDDLPEEPDDGLLITAFNIDPESGRILMEGDDKSYWGSLDAAVPFDEPNVKRYLGITFYNEAFGPDSFTATSPESWGGNGGGHVLPAWEFYSGSDRDGAFRPYGLRCYVPPEGNTDADLCVVLRLEDGRELIVFLYEQ